MVGRTQFDFAERWRIIKLKPTLALRRKRKRIGLGIALSLILVMISVFPWAYALMLQSQLDSLNIEIGKYKDVDNLLQIKSKLESDLKGREQELALIKAREKNPREILEQLGQLLPGGSTINQFALADDNNLSIKVSVPGPIDVARLWVSLRDSGLTVSDINTVSLTNDRKVLSFQFKFNQ